MRTRKHTIYVTLRDGTKLAYQVYARTRQDAKYFMFRRIFKWACYGKTFVGAYVNKFNPQNYLAKVSA